ncbi:hypothetical protein C8039_19560 [Halogeometricum sp. wsp3]|nr:hypothetical protein C8039_19560 [Halogeometricum sp. wsp3]
MLELFEIEHVAHESPGISQVASGSCWRWRAVMTDLEMVLLGEPLAGVNPTLEEKLIDRLHTLKEQGYTFLFVEHDMDVIMNNCDTVIVMHQGSVLTEGKTQKHSTNSTNTSSGNQRGYFSPNYILLYDVVFIGDSHRCDIK